MNILFFCTRTFIFTRPCVMTLSRNCGTCVMDMTAYRFWATIHPNERYGTESFMFTSRKASINFHSRHRFSDGNSFWTTFDPDLTRGNRNASLQKPRREEFSRPSIRLSGTWISLAAGSHRKYESHCERAASGGIEFAEGHAWFYRY